MPKIFFAVAIAALIVGYVIFMPNESAENANTSQIDPQQAAPKATPTAPTQTTTATRLPPPMGIANIGLSTSTQARTLGNQLLAPSEAAQIALENSSVLPSDLADEVYIAFNRDQIAQLRKDAHFNIPIPQLDSQFEAVVNEVVTHPNGDKTVRAQLTQTDEDYSVTITQGEDATYATIGTPEGVYVLEAQGENGWITSRTAMRGNHNFGVTDAVAPPVVPQAQPPVAPQGTQAPQAAPQADIPSP